MLGIEIKRGVEATLERVFHATGNHFDKLTVVWNGKTAGVCAKKIGNSVDANVIFPSIDETKAVDKKLFNKLIGYALHELGHVWFTNNKPWDDARENGTAFLSALINGLEDPRIERCVYQSDYAPNARALFENLTNAILEKDGYVQPDDFKNIPFMLAIEGRRLNGYSISVPSIVDQSPWAEPLKWALQSAHKARSTAKIVEIAIELEKRLRNDEPPEDNPSEPTDPVNPGEPTDSGEPGESGDDNGEAGEQGEPGDQGQPGDKPGNDKGDKKTKRGANGKDDKPREVEPTDFINDELSKHKADCDQYRERPHVGKPVFTDVYFY
jgi:hypothetical protein